jgi:hypothetical protein
MCDKDQEDAIVAMTAICAIDGNRKYQEQLVAAPGPDGVEVVVDVDEAKA